MKHYASRLDFWATMYGEANKWMFKYREIGDEFGAHRYWIIIKWIDRRMERAMK